MRFHEFLSGKLRPPHFLGRDCTDTGFPNCRPPPPIAIPSDHPIDIATTSRSTTSPPHPIKPPEFSILRSILVVGLAAARINLIPGLLLQAVMVAILIGYYLSPTARAGFGHLADLKAATGYAFSFFAAALAGGLLPELLRITLFQRFRLRRENLSSFLFGFFFWGVMGLLVDAFYRLQAELFGTDPTPAVVASKVLLDMLLFTPLIGVPFATTGYVWKASHFDPAIFREVLSPKGYRAYILPVLLPNWAVWGPVVCVIYALPAGLQIPVYVLAQAFWTLMLTTLTAKRPDPVPSGRLE